MMTTETDTTTEPTTGPTMETTTEKTEEREYLSCAKTAKLVRKALKREFPGQKFSVRSKTYAGGASIRVQWENGVPQRDVESVLNRFEGADFDGMVDMKTYKHHWLLPNGTVELADAQGACSYDEQHYEKPHPDAKKVSFGADFIFAERTITDDTKKALAQAVANCLGWEFNGDLSSQPAEYKGSMDRWYDIVWRVAKNLDLSDFNGSLSYDLDSGNGNLWESFGVVE